MRANDEIKLEEKLEDITGITCIYIPVKDVYESIQWYQKNLGCEPTTHNPIKPGMKHSIMEFPNHNGEFQGAGLRISTLFLFSLRKSGNKRDRKNLSHGCD